MGLIGKEMFAVEGCKMPSNASKEWSGTKEELQHKKEKMEHAIRQILKRHREMDIKEKDRGIVKQEEKYVETIKSKVKKIKAWLKDNDDKPGKTGKPVNHHTFTGVAFFDTRFARNADHSSLSLQMGLSGVVVNTQWLLYCIVHNITKVHRYAGGFA